MNRKPPYYVPPPNANSTPDNNAGHMQKSPSYQYDYANSNWPIMYQNCNNDQGMNLQHASAGYATTMKNPCGGDQPEPHQYPYDNAKVVNRPELVVRDINGMCNLVKNQEPQTGPNKYASLKYQPRYRTQSFISSPPIPPPTAFDTSSLSDQGNNKQDRSNRQDANKAKHSYHQGTTTTSMYKDYSRPQNRHGFDKRMENGTMSKPPPSPSPATPKLLSKPAKSLIYGEGHFNSALNHHNWRPERPSGYFNQSYGSQLQSQTAYRPAVNSISSVPAPAPNPNSNNIHSFSNSTWGYGNQQQMQMQNQQQQLSGSIPLREQASFQIQCNINPRRRMGQTQTGFYFGSDHKGTSTSDVKLKEPTIYGQKWTPQLPLPQAENEGSSFSMTNHTPSPSVSLAHQSVSGIPPPPERESSVPPPPPSFPSISPSALPIVSSYQMQPQQAQPQPQPIYILQPLQGPGGNNGQIQMQMPVMYVLTPQNGVQQGAGGPMILQQVQMQMPMQSMQPQPQIQLEEQSQSQESSTSMNNNILSARASVGVPPQSQSHPGTNLPPQSGHSHSHSQVSSSRFLHKNEQLTQESPMPSGRYSMGAPSPHPNNNPMKSTSRSHRSHTQMESESCANFLNGVDHIIPPQQYKAEYSIEDKYDYIKQFVQEDGNFPKQKSTKRLGHLVLKNRPVSAFRRSKNYSKISLSSSRNGKSGMMDIIDGSSSSNLLEDKTNRDIHFIVGPSPVEASKENSELCCRKEDLPRSCRTAKGPPPPENSGTPRSTTSKRKSSRTVESFSDTHLNTKRSQRNQGLNINRNHLITSHSLSHRQQQRSDSPNESIEYDSVVEEDNLENSQDEENEKDRIINDQLLATPTTSSHTITIKINQDHDDDHSRPYIHSDVRNQKRIRKRSNNLRMRETEQANRNMKTTEEVQHPAKQSLPLPKSRMREPSKQDSYINSNHEEQCDFWPKPEPGFMRDRKASTEKEISVGDKSVGEGMALIEDKNSWERNVCGYRVLSIQVQFQEEHVLERLTAIIPAVQRHIRTSVSKVSRQAILTLRDILTVLGPHFDPFLQTLSERLFSKMMNTNKFIKDDCEGTLEAMVMHCSHPKMIQLLETYARKHKHSGIRLVACRLITKFIGIVGVESALNDYGEFILPLLCNNLAERTGEIREEARSGLKKLLTHDHFDTFMRQFVSPQFIISISQRLDRVREEVTEKGEKNKARPRVMRNRSLYKWQQKYGHNL